MLWLLPDLHVILKLKLSLTAVLETVVIEIPGSERSEVLLSSYQQR